MSDVELLYDNDLICYSLEINKGTIVKAIQSSGCKTKNPQKRSCPAGIKKLIELCAEKDDAAHYGCCLNEKEK